MFLFRDIKSFWKNRFGERVQKIPVDIGFSCTESNSKSCTYCLPSAFKPFYCSHTKPLKQQLQEGKAFFSNKYKIKKFVVFFQSLLLNHISRSVLEKTFSSIYEEKDVIGVVISTRPDCINSEILAICKEFSEDRVFIIELGIETCDDKVLEHIGRQYTFSQVITAVNLVAEAGIPVCGHIILGLPGESLSLEKTASILSNLPLWSLKIHHLQVLRGTLMEIEYSKHPERFRYASINEYIHDLVIFLENIRSDIFIERFVNQVPPELLVFPKWGKVKNNEFIELLKSQFIYRKSYQGKKIVSRDPP